MALVPENSEHVTKSTKNSDAESVGSSSGESRENQSSEIAKLRAEMQSTASEMQQQLARMRVDAERKEMETSLLRKRLAMRKEMETVNTPRHTSTPGMERWQPPQLPPLILTSHMASVSMQAHVLETQRKVESVCAELKAKDSVIESQNKSISALQAQIAEMNASRVAQQSQQNQQLQPGAVVTVATPGGIQPLDATQRSRSAYIPRPVHVVEHAMDTTRAVADAAIHSHRQQHRKRARASQSHAATPVRCHRDH
jgi:hypothetical protein